MSEGPCLAQRCFDARDLASALEDEIADFCEQHGIGLQWTEYWVDPYDSSIEFGKCPNDMRLTRTQEEALKAAGFQRCWLNHEDGTETYYDFHDRSQP